MGTRCNIRFNEGSLRCANIFRHWDGYPGRVSKGVQTEHGVLGDLLEFFRELKDNVADRRFGEADCLAAKFVVWQAKKSATERIIGFDETGNPEKGVPHYLDFLNVAPVLKDAPDGEYLYEVDCEKRDTEGFPAIRWKPSYPESERYRTVYLSGKKG